MSVANLIVGQQLLGVLLGLVASYAILFLGVPARLRLQDRPHPPARFHSHLPLIALNLGVLLGGAWIFATLYPGVFSLARPPGWVIAGQCALVLGVDDLWFYGLHRAIHVHKGLYRRIHRIHHEAFSPLPLEYIYVHPLEWILGSLGMVIPFLAIYLVTGAIPLGTLLVCASLRQLHELDIHSGVRAVLLRWLPILAPADHHDLHHAKPNCGNYGSTTLLWDWVFGTEAPSERRPGLG